MDVAGETLPVRLDMRRLIERECPVLRGGNGAQDTINLLPSFGCVSGRLQGFFNQLPEDEASKLGFLCMNQGVHHEN